VPQVQHALMPGVSESLRTSTSVVRRPLSTLRRPELPQDGLRPPLRGPGDSADERATSAWPAVSLPVRAAARA